MLDDLVLELIERETLSKEDLERIFAPVHKRPPHSTYAGFGKRTPSDQPPVMTPSELQAVRRPAAVRPTAAAPGMPAPGPRPSPAAGSPRSTGANGGRAGTAPRRHGHPARRRTGSRPYGPAGYGRPDPRRPPTRASRRTPAVSRLPGGQPPYPGGTRRTRGGPRDRAEEPTQQARR